MEEINAEDKNLIDAYERIKSTIETTGWKDIEAMFSSIYCEALDRLIRATTTDEANMNRATIIVIETLMSQIHTSYNFGRVTREKYTNSKISNGE